MKLRASLLAVLMLIGMAPAVSASEQHSVKIIHVRISNAEPVDLTLRTREIRKLVKGADNIFAQVDLKPRWKTERGSIPAVYRATVTDASWQTIAEELAHEITDEQAVMLFVESANPTRPIVSGYGGGALGNAAIIFNYPGRGWEQRTVAHELVHIAGFTTHVDGIYRDLMTPSRAPDVSVYADSFGCTYTTIDCRGEGGYIDLLQTSPFFKDKE